jgi:hypothetical protein
MGSLIDGLRQPEYTGENRCTPCTVVNSLIAIALAAGVAAAGTAAVAPAVGIAAGIAVIGVSAAAIYLRGYLVPKTPELTKRYLPPWLLDLFGKAPEQSAGGVSVEGEAEINPEETLVAAGALEECEDVDDLCLVDEFQDDWYVEIERVDREDAGRERLLALLGVDEGEVEFIEYGEAFRAHVDGVSVGTWESEAAFLADLGAAAALSDRLADWEQMPVEARSQLLSGVRIFLDSCPECGGEPELGTETVESCCSTHEVAAVACPDCDARLFESPV